jgi:penicillin amidase
MILGPMVAKCLELEPNFQYRWKQQDVPLMALIDASNPETLPSRYTSWKQLLETSVKETLQTLGSKSGGEYLGQKWGQVSQIKIQHPFSRKYPWINWLLDMPPIGAACDAYCVKVLNQNHGASERMVISPNHPEDGLFEMPGGQSGSPLSANYRDEQSNWVKGQPEPFKPEAARTKRHWSPANRD